MGDSFWINRSKAKQKKEKSQTTKFTLTRTFRSTKTNTLKEHPLHVHIQLNTTHNSEQNHGRIHLLLISKVQRSLFFFFNIIHRLHGVTVGNMEAGWTFKLRP